jgi:tetratricopeptide (TPR) repeat protein
MTSSTHHDRGNAAYREGDYAGALAHYTRAIQNDPRNNAVFSNRAACRYFLQQYPEALADAQYASKLKANYPKAYFWQGAALVKLDRLPEARGALTQAVRLDATNPKATALLEEVKAKLAAAGAGEERLPKAGKRGRDDDEAEMDLDADIQAKKKKTRGEEAPQKRNPMAEVDVESGHAHHGVVLSEGGLWHVRLSKREQAFRMQVIEVPATGAGDQPKYFFFLAAEWPFKPGKAQLSVTELSKDEAKHSFRRIYRERTGLEWQAKGRGRTPKGKFVVDRI